MAKSKFEEWLEASGLTPTDLAVFTPRSVVDAMRHAWDAGVEHAGGDPCQMMVKVETIGRVAKMEFMGCPDDFAARLAEAFGCNNGG